MRNHDVKKERRDLYSARRDRFEIVDVPRMSFLTADGRGDPSGAAGTTGRPSSFWGQRVCCPRDPLPLVRRRPLLMWSRS
ncbi:MULTISPECIES: hypothetical protein [unclassified Streptomyces]|uniref:hypothetical protein n=1 Tax=unclassified Streptomyces TaxID=2593676 RepID=UPI0007EDD967|nr:MULTISPECIES: hypothetical protein [unclassified Streptomyces]MCP3767831.1 hypothetical protein [Streptomyces sp. MAR25Y5]OBQ53275.1 hypothetical protein A4U61_03480 [Streptomyces sp. H-KF8]